MTSKSVDPTSTSTSGRPPKYSADDVIAAAVNCVARTGLDALTVRAVATELGSSPMALYRHIDSRDDLVARVIDDVLGRVELQPLPTTQQGRHDWLKHMCLSLHSVLTQYPGVAEQLMTIGPTGPLGFQYMDKICQVLLDSGLSPQDASDRYTLLMVTAAGFCARSARVRVLAESLQIEPAMLKQVFAERASLHGADLPALRIVARAFRDDGTISFGLALESVISSVLPPADD